MVHKYCIFFVRSPDGGHLSCFLVVVNNSAVNVGVNVLPQCVWIRCFCFFFFSNIPRSGITGSYGCFIFSFLRSFHTVFYTGCTSLHPATVLEVSRFLTSFSASVICCLWMVTILTGVRWCVSLMISNMELLFTCLLAICISSLENVCSVILPSLIELLVIEESLHLCDKFHLVIVYDRCKLCLS